MATWWSLLLFLPVSARGIVKRPGLKQSVFDLHWLAGKWKNAEISLDFTLNLTMRRDEAVDAFMWQAGEAASFRAGGFDRVLFWRCFCKFPKNFNHQSLQKGSELCFFWITTESKLRKSKEINGLQKVRFSPPENFMQFWFTLWYDPGNWAERGILMSQDAESPDRPLVLVFYGWLVPKLTENRWCGSSKLFVGNPPLVNLVLLKYILHPWNLTWNLKRSPWKGDSFWKPSFSGSMLNFGGVYEDYILYAYFSFPNWDLNLSSCLIRNTMVVLWRLTIDWSYPQSACETASWAWCWDLLSHFLGQVFFVSHRIFVQKE